MKIIDYSISKEVFSIVYDKEIEGYRTSPTPDNLDFYYQSDDYISHTDANRTFFEKVYQVVKDQNLKYKKRLVNQYSLNKHSILDYGCGTGDFLLQMQKSNWNVSGIEPNLKAIKLAKQKGISILDFEELKKSSSKFNVLTLWHVLEHLPDLNNKFRLFSDLLDQQGVLIIAVPNFKSWDAFHYKKFWAGYDVPRHLWHFSKKSIKLLAKKHNFELLDTHPMYFDSVYVSILSEKYKNASFSFLKGALKGIYSNLHAFFKTNEYSSQIYVLKKK